MPGLTFEVRPSTSRLIDCVWRSTSTGAAMMTSIASGHWNLVVGQIQGRLEVALHGPETRVHQVGVPPDSTWVGIRFRLGTSLSGVRTGRLLDSGVDLQLAGGDAFLWQGSRWCLPTYDNAEDVIARLGREDLIGRDRIVEDALRSGLTGTGLSVRTVQRRFVESTGLPHRAVRQIEQARKAAVRLREGATPVEVAHELGYFDQPHLTHSLARFVGSTPAVLRNSGDSQLSLLYKTDAAGMPTLTYDQCRPSQPAPRRTVTTEITARECACAT